MDERVVDYFVVAGLPDENPKLVDEDLCEGLNPNQQNIEPITDITVIFPTLGEYVPKGFSCVEQTPTGYPANLNSGSIRSPEVYLCYRRGRDKPPLVDIGVMYDGKERLLPDAEVVLSTPEGRPANVNNTSARILLTFRRAPEDMPCNELVVTDICVIFQNKGEKPPHAFCLIQKNLNKGMMGCDVYLCYKKSMNRPPLLSFKPEVLLRYPPIDHKSFEFPPLTATFCLPMCATIECWPKIATQPRPVFSTFVLTVADATEKIYGAAITFYEKYSDDKLSKEQKEILGIVSANDRIEKGVHVNKCICLLSHHPFFDAFRTFLYYLYWMIRNGSHEVPIERYISHLMNEVPFPSAQRPHILMQLSSTQNLLFSHPQDSPLPKSGAAFRSMLSNLGPENCLMVLCLVLTEQKLLIHSLRPDVLTAVAEAISVLIFPYRWQCPFIPLCPLALCGVLQAPVPFLVGVDSRFFDLYEPPTDVTCIDLDTNTITVSDDKKYLLSIKMLPKKPARVLKSTLEAIKLASDRMAMSNKGPFKGRGDVTEAMEVDFQLKRRERLIEMEVQEAFLRFMTNVLKGYRSYLLPITKAPTIGATDASSLFDFQGFLRSRDKTYQKFYQFMLRTQMFFRFIEERSFVSENDSSLEFFDECCDKMEADDTETVKLLEINEGNQSERTVFVMPPEPVGLPASATYSYHAKFNLKEGLFMGPKLKSHSLDRVMQQNEQSMPGSPVARRTKQEIRSAQKIAKKYSEKPHLWAKYLLSTCYSIWFIHLPSYASIASSKHMALCLAYEILARMGNFGLQPADEVCYRVVMQLCGLYSQPVIAVKVLLKMKRCGMTPNAITYGYYNKAVLEAEWPSNVSNSSQLMWNKLRNVILGVAQFRTATRHRQGGNEEIDRISTGSGLSVDSQNTLSQVQSAQPGRLQSSACLSPQSISNDGNSNGKSQSDSEVTSASTATIPTRISSSSDVGYGSMHEQKISSEPDIVGDPEVDYPSSTERQPNKTTRFWGKMGQSLDQWVKSGVSSLASLAADTSYYSQSGVLMGSGYMGGDYVVGDRSDQYDDEDDEDEFEDQQLPKVRDFKAIASRRKLEFTDDDVDSMDEKNQNQTLRLLRSVSFGNDTQIMSKLKELKDEIVAENRKKKEIDSLVHSNAKATEQLQQNPLKKSPQDLIDKLNQREASVESNGSLEAKINKFYENMSSEDPSREVSVDKSTSNSREQTPDESHESYQDTLRPNTLNPPRSPSIQIKSREAQLSREVTPNSPSRTPVTQNDPLGALSEPCTPESNSGGSSGFKRTVLGGSTGTFIQSDNRDSPKRTCSEGNIGGGISDQVLMGPPETPKNFHRSSTLPNYPSCIGDRTDSNASMNSAPSDEKLSAGGPGGVSSLTVFSSGLKNPFGRYSPGRLSLRKAGSSLIESTIGNKKAEALMEGFNQFKSVATVTMKTKLEELKEAVGNNTTPGKSGPFGRYEDDQADEWDGEPASDQWASVSESYLDQVLTTEPSSTRASVDYGIATAHTDGPLSSSRQSLSALEHLKYITGPSSKLSSSRPVAVEISMTTCSLCHNCSSLLFDEEIMAGWTAEDSNLNSRCPHCKKWEVPFLQVSVVDFRHNPMPQLLNLPLTSAPSLESMNSSSNLSRRMSLINPGLAADPSSSTTLNQVLQKIKIDEEVRCKEEATVTVQCDITDQTDGHCVSKPKSLKPTSQEEVSSESTLDPLGVLEEEIRGKSSRNSPEIDITPQPTEITTVRTEAAISQTHETNEKQPSISVSTPVPPNRTSSSEYISYGATRGEPKSIVDYEGVAAEPIVVPYLSPLVLRKELENVLDHEGDSSLVQSKFVDEHPIIYWNLVWFFNRANLPSHIKGLSLHAKSVTPTKITNKPRDPDSECPAQSTPERFTIHPSWDGADHRNVLVRCMWDNPKYHDQFSTPLYQHWFQSKDKAEKSNEEDNKEHQDNNLSKLMANVLRATQGNSLAQTCPQLLFHYHKQSSGRHYPTYRDILFLSVVAGRDSAEAYGFGLDKEYRDVYSKLRGNDDYESMDIGDLPPSDTALFCRRFFRELELQ